MDIQALEKMLENGRDSAMMRLSLAGALQQSGELRAALAHLHSAVQQDPDYTAAWKVLGKLQLELGDTEGARLAWQQGVEIASQRGDKQAQKEADAQEEINSDLKARGSTYTTNNPYNRTTYTEEQLEQLEEALATRKVKNIKPRDKKDES